MAALRQSAWLALVVLGLAARGVWCQCNHDHDHGAHGHAEPPSGPARPTTNDADVPGGPYTSACKGCKLQGPLVDCKSCKSSVFESNYEALQTSKECAGVIQYTFDGEAGALACEPRVCKAIKIAGKSWMSGQYTLETQGDWEHGVDGSPVYAKASGKSFLYLFKQGPTWRIGRKPGKQSAIAVLKEADTLLAQASEWSLYSSKSKKWVPEPTTTGTCVEAAGV